MGILAGVLKGVEQIPTTPGPSKGGELEPPTVAVSVLYHLVNNLYRLKKSSQNTIGNMPFFVIIYGAFIFRSSKSGMPAGHTSS